MVFLFWISLALVAYVYAGYPALLALAARWRARPVRRDVQARPTLSILVAARHEAARLPARLTNLLGLDYPADRREIVVALDGADGDTLAALAPFRDRVRILTLPPGGKPAALNAAVAAARHDILVFADARQRFAPDALTALAANFADADVGGVSGELVLDCEAAGGARTDSIGEGVGLYWRYEKWLRRNESAIGSLAGATGAIYALRRSLWRPLPEHALLDDVLAPMRAVLAGWRVVFDPRAVAYDEAPADAAVESRRKLRTLAGNYQILLQEPRLLVPGLNPIWIQYLSHKVGRLAVPYALAGLFVSSAALVEAGAVYALAFAGQSAFYLLAVYGGWLESRDRRQAAAAGPGGTCAGAVNVPARPDWRASVMRSAGGRG